MNNLLKAFLMMLFVFSFSRSSFGQEFLEALWINPNASGEFNMTSSILKSESWVFHNDTLEIPFIDDFTKDHFRHYNIASTHFLVNDSTYHSLEINGNVDSIFYGSFDTTYVFNWNVTNQNYTDTSPQNPVEIVTLSDGIPTDTVYFWNAYHIYDSLGVLTIDSISEDTTIFNVYNTVYYASDSPYFLWMDDQLREPRAFINHSLCISPPTYGVVSFDGVDENGEPYDFSAQTTWGVADLMTSKPINLDYPASDSVYLSFYYQPEGNGNPPDGPDSLVLEFFHPNRGNNGWTHIWSTAGIPNQDFEEVKIAITDTSWLRNGFQFRFKNYATLSGYLDHWNIDYVRLDKGRSMDSTDVLTDVAFKEVRPTFLHTYTQMPWRHYKENRVNNTKGQIPFTLNNLGISGRQVDHYFQVKELDNTQLFQSVIKQSPNLVPGVTDMNMEITFSPNYFLFPIDTLDSHSFKVNHYHSVSPDDNRDNDTITLNQQFNSWYALDDNVVDKAYSLVGSGAKLAEQFSLQTTDTLKAVWFYFPYMLENIELRSFKLKIWTSLFPESAIYSGPLVNPAYSSTLNEFVRYELDSTIILGPGEYYVGWEQLEPEKIYLGFDQTLDNQNRIFYNTGGGWFNTLFTGTLMIRPDFGDVPITVGTSELVNEFKDKLSVFPNPCTDFFSVNSDLEETVHLELLDLLGNVVFNKRNILNFETINVKDLSFGTYLIKFKTNQGKLIHSCPLIIQ